MARGARPAPGRWISAALVGGLWWWALGRLVLSPGSTGPVEGAVAAAGWGLSLLPVHCVPWTGRGGRPRGGAAPGVPAELVRAWRFVRLWRRRSGVVLRRWWRTRGR
ncbi:hypothetical protein MUU72_23900 [Streptomyces sp. RS10V-4]|uniref:hypothetical protein n=1 Tax=Streptomyces rhizoryzae TaxID=2932493 RepID=UPI002003A2B0|nr:hypothetical protein [Streptomyces rhizoryzae]MCK7626111.1 hypothetical protein [Streptomyces rhizoryzae]